MPRVNIMLPDDLLKKMDQVAEEVSMNRSQLVRTAVLAYFDQLRDTLKEEESVQFNVNDGKEFIELGGRRTHVNGYLQDFLFKPERARSPARVLSGGERNRLLLAKLFIQSANAVSPLSFNRI